MTRKLACADKETRKLLAWAAEHGWTIRVSRNSHIQALSPDGAGIVTVSSTPGHRSSLKDAEADMRRLGLPRRS